MSTFAELSDDLKNQIIEDRKRNESKYGTKDKDVISEAYEQSKLIGDAYCLLNARKYMKRYISNSNKANNPSDLRKAIDYLLRALEKNENQFANEIIEK